MNFQKYQIAPMSSADCQIEDQRIHLLGNQLILPRISLIVRSGDKCNGIKINWELGNLL